MKRKGFTLVELLIVLMIIGVLSASMSLVNGKATASAKVSTIISNLRTLKSAAMLFYADYYMESSDTEFTTDNITNASADYLGTAAASMTGYGFLITTSAPKKWYVYYYLGHNDVKNDPDINSIKKKLIANAKKVGLLGSDKTTAAPTAAFGSDTKHTYAFLQVR